MQSGEAAVPAAADGTNRFVPGGHRISAMPQPIDHSEVRRLVSEESARLVEVLPAKEFSEEHITGAINIPLKELDERATRELDRERPVIVYCNDYQ